MSETIRRATLADAAQLVEIYRPSIEDSNASFELVCPGVDEFADRIRAALENHEWLVLETGEQICGYAYGTAHRKRAAYDLSVETSVYVHSKFHGRGIGKRLYQQLFISLQQMGFHNAYAGITLPNAASVALHESFGFKTIGVFREIGFKNDQWHDVGWWQRPVAKSAN